MSRALELRARPRVTLVGSLGNDHEDLGNPRPDIISPDFPPGTEYPRTIDNATCLDLPVEGPHVIGVSALGPSEKKADYSNYGLEQITVSAPGGWFRDGFGTPTFRTNGNLILSTYPRTVLQAQGLVDAAGNITPAGDGARCSRPATAAGTAATTATCRARRWRHRTPPVSPRYRQRVRAQGQGTAAGSGWRRTRWSDPARTAPSTPARPAAADLHQRRPASGVQRPLRGHHELQRVLRPRHRRRLRRGDGEARATRLTVKPLDRRRSPRGRRRFQR